MAVLRHPDQPEEETGERCGIAQEAEGKTRGDELDDHCEDRTETEQEQGEAKGDQPGRLHRSQR
jgi:hypothetical protein